MFQFGIINNFRRFQIIFPISGTTGDKMPLVSFLDRKSCFGIQLNTVQSAEERTVMHPPLSGSGISYNTRVDGIHYRSCIGLDHTSPLHPRSFGRCGFRQSYIGCLKAKSRDTVIKPVFVTERYYIRSPDIGCPFPVCMRTHPFYRLMRYFRESPADKFPLNKIFGATYLYETQRNILLLGFFTVLPQNGIGGIHIIIITQFTARRIMYIVSSPRVVIVHRRQSGIVILPGIGRSHRSKNRRVTASKQNSRRHDNYT